MNDRDDIQTHVEAFIEQESDLLDAGDLVGWVDLCTDDATYWMPMSADQTDPLGEISLLYENRTLMEIRKFNFGHRLSPAFESPVRCSHILGNIRTHTVTEATITASTKFHCIMWYRAEQRMFAGRATYELTRVDDGLRLRAKRVDLLNADAWHKSIPIYL